MKRAFLMAVLCWGGMGLLVAQSPDAAAAARQQSPMPSHDQGHQTWAATISAEDLRNHLSVLASDEFEGRETGTPGNKMAAQYIAQQFAQFGLPPVVGDDSYFQAVAFNWSRWRDISIRMGEKKYRHGRDFIAFPTRNASTPLIETTEIVFLGYGIETEDYNDYEGVDVENKVLLIYKGEPFDKKGISQISGTKTASEWTSDWEKKAEAAYRNGAKAILIIENELQKFASRNRSRWFGRQVTLGQTKNPAQHYANNLYISSSIAKRLLGDKYKEVIKARKRMQKKGKSKSIRIPVTLKIQLDKMASTLQGDNVLGYIEGSDPVLKDELVVVTAHYDHLGKRGQDIYNGADDNGSGTSTVLEVAQALAEAKAQGQGARRSVLCMLVTGEEKGLLGSQFYTERPIFPLERTIVDINVDMVGRVDEKYADNPEYIYVIGSDRLSTELHEINERMNTVYTQLTLDYTYNERDDPNRYYYRSDHYNFAENGRDALFRKIIVIRT
ncbi:MAG: M28 family peptidase, partial [Bacteroidota bacterium]